MVFTLVGLGAGALWRWRPRRSSGGCAAPTPGRGTHAGPLRACGALLRRASPRHRRGRCSGRLEPDPPAAGRASGRRISGRRGSRRPDPRRDRRRHADHASLDPRLQVDRGVRVPADPCRRVGPVADRGAALWRARMGPSSSSAIHCSRRSIGAPCGGPAEATVAPAAAVRRPVDRFRAAPGRTISVYRGALAPLGFGAFVMRSGTIRLDRGSIHASPASSGGGEPSVEAPRPRDRRARESALEDLRISSHEPAVGGAYRQAASTRPRGRQGRCARRSLRVLSASTTFRDVARAARSKVVEPVPDLDHDQCTSGIVAKGDVDRPRRVGRPVGSSKSARRPCRRARPSTSSWAAKVTRVAGF